MTALYNELDPYPAQWLRNLADAGHIAPGRVVQGCVTELEPSVLADFRQVHLFAGIGVWSYALRLAGWPDDVPVWTGSCPCQPFSTAGRRRGVNDERHLWPAMYRLITQCRPAVIFGEQVSSPTGRTWFAAVRADLEAVGYRVAAADLCAAGVGAPHIRQRLYWVAYAAGQRREGFGVQLRQREPQPTVSETVGCCTRGRWSRVQHANGYPIEPGSIPLVNRTASTVGKLRAYGNAIVPQLAAEFITAAVAAIKEQPCTTT